MDRSYSVNKLKAGDCFSTRSSNIYKVLKIENGVVVDFEVIVENKPKVVPNKFSFNYDIYCTYYGNWGSKSGEELLKLLFRE